MVLSRQAGLPTVIVLWRIIYKWYKYFALPGSISDEVVMWM